MKYRSVVKRAPHPRPVKRKTQYDVDDIEQLRRSLGVAVTIELGMDHSIYKIPDSQEYHRLVLLEERVRTAMQAGLSCEAVAKMVDLAAKCQCDSFMLRFPDGKRTEVGDDGAYRVRDSYPHTSVQWLLSRGKLTGLSIDREINA